MYNCVDISIIVTLENLLKRKEIINGKRKIGVYGLRGAKR